jgi:hypothetical protein
MKKLIVFFFLIFAIPANAQDFKRLSQVADYLEALNPKDFNMCSWNMCAAGYATDIFYMDGFELDGITVIYKDKFGIYATMKFFALDYGQAAYLFGGSHLTCKEEIKKIREFNATKINIKKIENKR